MFYVSFLKLIIFYKINELDSVKSIYFKSAWQVDLIPLWMLRFQNLKQKKELN